MIAKDAVELIQGTAVKAASASVLLIPGDDSRAVLVSNGTKEFIDLPPKRRDHEAHDLDSLCRFVDDHLDDEQWSAVWHNDSAVTAVVNDDDRRDVMTFGLQKSKAFTAIGILQQRFLTQAELVRLLRVDLAGCVDPLLVTTIRTLNFRRNDATNADLQHQKQSLGRAVEASVSGASDLPETFDIKCEIYGNVETGIQTFPIVLEVNFEQQNFKLTPMGDCLTKNLQAAQNAIAEEIDERLGEKRVFVYFGAP